MKNQSHVNDKNIGFASRNLNEAPFILDMYNKSDYDTRSLNDFILAVHKELDRLVRDHVNNPDNSRHYVPFYRSRTLLSYPQGFVTLPKITELIKASKPFSKYLVCNMFQFSVCPPKESDEQPKYVYAKLYYEEAEFVTSHIANLIDRIVEDISSSENLETENNAPAYVRQVLAAAVVALIEFVPKITIQLDSRYEKMHKQFHALVFDDLALPDSYYRGQVAFNVDRRSTDELSEYLVNHEITWDMKIFTDAFMSKLPQIKLKDETETNRMSAKTEEEMLNTLAWNVSKNNIRREKYTQFSQLLKKMNTLQEAIFMYKEAYSTTSSQYQIDSAITCPVDEEKTVIATSLSTANKKRVVLLSKVKKLRVLYEESNDFQKKSIQDIIKYRNFILSDLP